MPTESPQLLTPSILADARLYTRVTLPVFGPHVRQWKNSAGELVTIEVAERDLPRVCEASNRPWRETYTPARLNIGHVRPGFQIPEADQPRNVGYSVNFRIAPLPTGQRWIWADLCQRVCETVPVADWPYRSADFDPATWRITGVALLRQDPFLDQGVVHYQASAGAVTPTYRGSTMNPTTQPPADPNEDAEFEKVAQYMKRKYPKLAQYMDDPAATSMMPTDPTESAPYQKLLVERELDRLDQVVGVRFDREKEAAKLVGLTPAGRAEHVAYMLSNYGRKPVAPGGGFLPVAPSGQLTPAEREAAPLTPTEAAQAVAYQKANGVEYVAAVKAARK